MKTQRKNRAQRHRMEDGWRAMTGFSRTGVEMNYRLLSMLAEIQTKAQEKKRARNRSRRAQRKALIAQPPVQNRRMDRRQNQRSFATE